MVHSVATRLARLRRILLGCNAAGIPVMNLQPPRNGPRTGGITCRVGYRAAWEIRSAHAEGRGRRMAYCHLGIATPAVPRVDLARRSSALLYIIIILLHQCYDSYAVTTWLVPLGASPGVRVA